MFSIEYDPAIKKLAEKRVTHYQNMIKIGGVVTLVLNAEPSLTVANTVTDNGNRTIDVTRHGGLVLLPDVPTQNLDTWLKAKSKHRHINGRVLSLVDYYSLATSGDREQQSKYGVSAFDSGDSPATHIQFIRLENSNQFVFMIYSVLPAYLRQRQKILWAGRVDQGHMYVCSDLLTGAADSFVLDCYAQPEPEMVDTPFVTSLPVIRSNNADFKLWQQLPGKTWGEKGWVN